MDNTYVKNPNYSPLDPKSTRYVTDMQAREEATKKASSLNELFAPFKDLSNQFKTAFDPNSFYTPPKPTTTGSAVPLVYNPNYNPNQTPAPATPTPLNPNYTPSNQQTTTPQSGGSYTVQGGDTLGAIAALYGTTPQAIANANGIADINKIQVGQKLTIGGAPAGGAVQGATVPANGQGANLGVNVPNGAGNAPQGAGETPASRLSPDELGNLATLAGKAGLSTDAFLGLIQGNSAATSTETDKIRNDLGIPNLVDQAFEKPEKTSLQFYKDLYDTSGLGDIKTKVAKLDETINKKRDDLVKATGEINSNPWLSQGTRQGRLKNLQELAYADINNDLEAKQQYLDLYDSGVSEIEKQIGFYKDDTTENRQLTVDKLNYLLTEAERVQAGQEQDSLTAGLRNIPDYLQGILDRESTQASRDIAEKLAGKSSSGSVGQTINDVIAAGGDAADIVTASGGGKQTTDAFRQSYEKTLNTLYQLTDLNKAFEVYKDNGGGDGLFKTANGELTGPIMGIIRSANPYDTKAQQIKAQLTALVPNLARGVYGEVGVLTDQDVALYQKTLPNLTSTKEVREALLAITAKSVYRALENKLLVQAKGGVDVSNFATDLKQMRNTTNDLLKSVGIDVEEATNQGGEDYTKADADYVASLGY